MLRPAIFALCLVALPASAWEWPVWLSAEDAESRLLGLVGTCAIATVEPEQMKDAFIKANWDAVEGEDGTYAFQSGDDFVMFWSDPGFCMFETQRLGTEALTAIVLEHGYESAGTDEAGCVRFQMPDVSELEAVTATLTGPGNDPVCTSDDGAAMRFQLN